MTDRGPAPHLPLRKKQRRIVRDNPGAMQAIGRGVKVAISECKHQFKKRRWNCPTSDYPRGKNIFGKIVQRGECACYVKLFVFKSINIGEYYIYKKKKIVCFNSFI